MILPTQSDATSCASRGNFRASTLAHGKCRNHLSKSPAMRAIVTGGAAFIGSHLVDALIRNDVAVLVVDDLSIPEESKPRGGWPRALISRGSTSVMAPH